MQLQLQITSCNIIWLTLHSSMTNCCPLIELQKYDRHITVTNPAISDGKTRQGESILPGCFYKDFAFLLRKHKVLWVKLLGRSAGFFLLDRSNGLLAFASNILHWCADTNVAHCFRKPWATAVGREVTQKDRGMSLNQELLKETYIMGEMPSTYPARGPGMDGGFQNGR